MGERFKFLEEKHIEFISKQKIFFVATATHDSFINLSPKGMDSIRVMSKSKVMWINATGSGNETAAHILENPRMTIMFAALEGSPMILRLYGNSKVYHKNDKEWNSLINSFDKIPAARQIFVLNIELVQKSCGFGVPLYSYSGERETLTNWALKQGDEGIEEYWKNKNQTSLNGKRTEIIERNLRKKD